MNTTYWQQYVSKQEGYSVCLVISCVSWVAVEYIKDILHMHQQCWCGEDLPVADKFQQYLTTFDVLLTVHLSIILVINQRNAQNLVL